MAGLSKRRNIWYARVSLWDGYHQIDKPISMKTKSKATARERLAEVNRYEKDIKQGLDYSFAWLNNDCKTKIQRLTLETTVLQYIKYKKRARLEKSSINRINNSLTVFRKLNGRSFRFS